MLCSSQSPRIPARARSSLAWCAGRRRTIDCGFPTHRLSSTTKSPAMEPCALGTRHGLHSGGGAATLMVGTASQLDRTESYLWISGQNPSRITASAAPISSARPIRPDAGRRSRPSPHPAAPRANTAQAGWPFDRGLCRIGGNTQSKQDRLTASSKTIGKKSLPRPWTRAGVRLILKGALRTALCPLSNRSPPRRNGN